MVRQPDHLRLQRNLHLAFRQRLAGLQSDGNGGWIPTNIVVVYSAGSATLDPGLRNIPTDTAESGAGSMANAALCYEAERGSTVTANESEPQLTLRFAHESERGSSFLLNESGARLRRFCY